MRQPLDPDQLEDLPLVLGEAFDHLQYAPRVRAEAGDGAVGRGRTPDSARAAAAGRSSRRWARSLSCQRTCWLASAKNWRTVGGRVLRKAVSSRATMSPSSSSVSRFAGGRVSRG